MTQLDLDYGDGQDYRGGGWLYVGYLVAKPDTIKVGHTRDLAARIKRHRQHGILVWAAWRGDEAEEHEFHLAHRAWRDPWRDCGRYECYHPHLDVVDDLVGRLWHAADRHELRLILTGLRDVDDVTRVLDNRAMAYMEQLRAADPDDLDGRPESARNPHGPEWNPNEARPPGIRTDASRPRAVGARVPYPYPTQPP